jgi:serine/threonine-protein kinase
MPPEPPAASAKKPVRIGKYEVLKHIANGGMGAVYKAHDVDLDRDVALKVLPAEMAANLTALERFRREARNAAKLRHENIVTIYEFGEYQGTWFLALEYVQGIDLHDYIDRKGKLDPEEARRITIQAALALQHAYQQGIVHRDIKPSNFLVTRKNGRLVVKMTDLGLSREARNDDFRVTRTGTTVGTVDYMAPEQARDSSKADTRSDIYSLGCTFYHMLAGQPPFNEGGLTERLYKHVQDEPPDMRQFNPRVSDGLLAVLRRMLAKQPGNRYQTPAELVKDLLDVEAVGAPARTRDVLAGLALGEESSEGSVDEPEAAPPRRPLPAAKRPTPGRIRAVPREETVEEKAPRTRAFPIFFGMPPWVVAVAAGALVFLLILAVLLIVRLSGVFPSREDAAPNERPGTHHAFRTARNAPRWLGDGQRPSRFGSA